MQNDHLTYRKTSISVHIDVFYHLTKRYINTLLMQSHYACRAYERQIPKIISRLLTRR